MLRLEISIFVEQDDDRYHAFCPGLPGLHADGSSPDEAGRNAAALVPVYLESLAQHGDPLPIGPHCTVHHEPEQFDFMPIPTRKSVTVQWPTMQMSGVS
jgi:predicted RNase H-like HicB family nuclease